VFTVVLDGVDLIIQLIKFGQAANDFRQMVLVFLIFGLQFTNFIWVWWILHARLRLPPLLLKNTAAFFGFTNKLSKEMTSKLTAAKEQLAAWNRARVSRQAQKAQREAELQ
jgi:hypothetical protein